MISALGTVIIQVEQVREIENISYCLVCIGNDERQTKIIAPKSVSDQRWSDTFKYEIFSSQQSDVEISIVKKSPIPLMKDKIKAHARIPVPIGDKDETKHDWFSLFPLPKKNMQKNVGIPSKVGEVRVSIQWQTAKPKVEKKLRGFIKEGQWTQNGGKLTNHSTWINNPQYLLQVFDEPKKHDVTVKIVQPEGKDNRMSFYILKYNKKIWKGRKKVVYTDQDSVRTDNMAPALFGEEPEATLDLEPGEYVVIPSSEDPEYVGSFTLNVWIKAIESDEEMKKYMNLSELGTFVYKEKTDSDKNWFARIITETWDEDTAGGGNIDGLRWRLNHQFLIRPPETETELCVVLGQPEKELSIGVYVLKYNGYGRRQIEYRDEIANSGQFKFLPTVGVTNLTIGPKDPPLLIIPCTHTTTLPDDLVDFTLSVFSSNPIHVSESTKSWEHISTCKTLWDVNAGTAGGSPNNETFLSNPQFVIVPTEDSDAEFLVDLTVPDASHAIGFVVVKRDRFEGDHAKDEVLKKYEKISDEEDGWQDDVFAQPKGWEKRVSLSTHFVGTKSTNATSVYYIIPSTFEVKIGKPFTVTVYSDQPFQLYEFVGNHLQLSDPEVKSTLSIFSPKKGLVKGQPSRRLLTEDLTITADTDLNAPLPQSPPPKKEKKEKKKKKSKKEKKATKEEASEEVDD